MAMSLLFSRRRHMHSQDEDGESVMEWMNNLYFLLVIFLLIFPVQRIIISPFLTLYTAYPRVSTWKEESSQVRLTFWRVCEMLGISLPLYYLSMQRTSS